MQRPLQEEGMRVWVLPGATPVQRVLPERYDDLPATLRRLYSEWELRADGQDLVVHCDVDGEAPAGHHFDVFLHALDDVRIEPLGEMAGPDLPEWAACTAVYFAVDDVFNDIVYIAHPPADHPARVFMVGASAPSLLAESGNCLIYGLAASVDEWLTRVIQFNGTDPLFRPPGDATLPLAIQRRLGRRCIELNPGLNDLRAKVLDTLQERSMD